MPQHQNPHGDGQIWQSQVTVAPIAKHSTVAHFRQLDCPESATVSMHRPRRGDRSSKGQHSQEQRPHLGAAPLRQDRPGRAIGRSAHVLRDEGDAARFAGNAVGAHGLHGAFLHAVQAHRVSAHATLLEGMEAALHLLARATLPHTFIAKPCGQANVVGGDARVARALTVRAHKLAAATARRSIDIRALETAPARLVAHAARLHIARARGVLWPALCEACRVLTLRRPLATVEGAPEAGGHTADVARMQAHVTDQLTAHIALPIHLLDSITQRAPCAHADCGVAVTGSDSL